MSSSKRFSLFALLLFACSGNDDAADDASVADGSSVDALVVDAGTPDVSIDAQAEDLPAPATDTAELLLNDVRYTLRSKLFCNATAGVGFQRSTLPDESTPTLFLHNVDFTATGDIVIMTNAAWHLDMDDVGAVWGTTPDGCAAQIVESSTEVFELTALGCSIKNQFGPGTGSASFRLRCTKGP
jgi:hypothetical protein